jgi:CBS domain-containing protein
MASTPAWRQPLKAWKRRFTEWIAAPTAQSVLHSLIFFDFRPAGPDGEGAALAEELTCHLHASVEAGRSFLGFMANQIIKNVPPVGFLGSFVVDKGGEHKDGLNLKIKGVAPIVDLVRLFSLEKGVRRTSTIERIHALADGRDPHTIVAEFRDELLSSFEFLLHLRLMHQRDQVEAGGRPDNYINPYSLGGLEKRTLKQAFGLTARLQDLVIERYRPFIW